MKASELILELERCIKSYGDISVITYDSEGRDYMDVDFADLSCEDKTKIMLS